MVKNDDIESDNIHICNHCALTLHRKKKYTKKLGDKTFTREKNVRFDKKTFLFLFSAHRRRFAFFLNIFFIDTHKNTGI